MAVTRDRRGRIVKHVGSVVTSEGVRRDAGGERGVHAVHVNVAVVEGVEQFAAEIQRYVLVQLERALNVHIPGLKPAAVERVARNGVRGMRSVSRNDPVNGVGRDHFAGIAGVPETRAGAEVAARHAIEPGVIERVCRDRCLRVAEHGTIVADTVAVAVISSFDVHRAPGLELRDARECPVVHDVADNLHGAFGVPHARLPDVSQGQALPVVISRRTPIGCSTGRRVTAELVRGLVVGGEDL